MGMRMDRRKVTSATAETIDRFEAAGHRQLFFWIYKNRAIHYNKEKAKGDAAMPLTHLDEQGRARMVDVGDKAYTRRSATAQARVRMQPQTLQCILSGNVPKGDVFACARSAGIMVAKRTAEWIPMCHPLPLDGIEVQCSVQGEDCVQITATVRCTYKTGVEMEALTAVSAAALTVYDMCKAMDRAMVIEQTLLLEKTGGKSGTFRRAME